MSKLLITGGVGMTYEQAKDYLYATLRLLTKNTDEEIRAYIELLETGQNKMSIAELEKIKEKIQNIPNDETTRPVGTYDYCVGAENERRINLEIIDKCIKELKGSE